MSFAAMGLSPEILKAIARMGFETPTPVQAQVIPRLLENKGDMVALAQTGTGKTAAFGLPILNMIDHANRSPQALILCPTRELCLQITRDLEAYASFMPAVGSVAIYGGAAIDSQIRILNKGVQIIVATPGRMLDILRRRKADLGGVERVILDEADEMLNMGFKEDLEAILAQVPDTAHTLLFSATMPRHVAMIARKYMHKPEEITIGKRDAGAENVSHECYVVHQSDRYRALKRIADFYPDMYAIVFCRTRQETQNVADWLIRDGYDVDALHGDLTQAQRDRVMKKFRAKGLQVLVATDVAARGLDVNDLTHVINYNLPDDLGGYTHRSGRTGRAGKSGVSVILINMREKGRARRIEQLIGKRFAYRDVPSGRDICEAQLLSLVGRMKSVDVDHEQIGPYLPGIFTVLEGMDREEIVTRFVSLELNTLLDYYRQAKPLSPGDTRPVPPKAVPRERVARAPEPAQTGVRLFINIGKQDGLTATKLITLIRGEMGVDVAIRRIDTMKTHSFFEVGVADVDAVVLSLAGAKYRGRAVRVEPVDEERVNRKTSRADRRKELHAGAGRPGGRPGKRPGPPRSKGSRPFKKAKGKSKGAVRSRSRTSRPKAR